MANLVIFWDHYVMTISQYTLHKKRSFSVFFITYFVVIPTKTYISLVSTLSTYLSIYDKTVAKKP